MYPGVYPSSLRLQTSNFTLIFILCSWPFFALGDSLSFSRRWSKVYTLSSQRRTVKLQLWRLGFYKKGPMGRGGSNVSCKCMGQLCRDFPENSFFLFGLVSFLLIPVLCWHVLEDIANVQRGIHSRKKGHSKEVTTHIDIAHPIGNPHSQLWKESRNIPLLVKVGHGVCVPAWCVGFFASRRGTVTRQSLFSWCNSYQRYHLIPTATADQFVGAAF